MDRHGTVVRLAGGSAVLALHARGLVSLLNEGRLVDDADGMAPSVPAGDTLVQLPAHQVLVPAVEREELLKRPGMDPRIQSDRFDGLARKVSELTSDVGADVAPSRRHGAAVKLLQEPIQGGTNGQQICGIHEIPLSSASPWGLSALGAQGLEEILSL